MCNFNRNINLYLFDCSCNNIEITNLSLHFDEILENDKNEFINELTLNFVNENMFLPLKFSNDLETAFKFGLFDSKNFMHLINIANFNHLILFERNLNNKITQKNDEDMTSSSNYSEESDQDSVYSEENKIQDCINNFDMKLEFFKK